ncbi:hypothetical protein [Nonomuraea angiospora]|uniref:hypothetical protein n=1 Tax=Nonomuraea angiospora TaxID=46172 RepID=UPI0029A1C823|nr:hypothetical protein [Nonomuraea angiospora]MDX3109715.1 hypothetical protein [Nonomuraea angiospora]
MNPHITSLRARLQGAARRAPGATETWQGPGEPDFIEEFTVVYADGTTLHVQIQEGACPAK